MICCDLCDKRVAYHTSEYGNIDEEWMDSNHEAVAFGTTNVLCSECWNKEKYGPEPIE